MRLPKPLLKRGFYLLYNELAFTYDLVAWLVSFGQWANWRRTALPYLQPGPTLELAYGTGGFYVDLLSAGLNPIGIDRSPYMARLTGKRLRRQSPRGEPPRGEPLRGAILQARAQALPFPDGCFVNVVATFPTRYIFEKETLAEVRRVLMADPGQSPRLIVVMQGRLQGPPGLQGFVDWLYRVTGQHDPLAPDPIAEINEAGFEATWEAGHFQSATADLIVAQIAPEKFM